MNPCTQFCSAYGTRSERVAALFACTVGGANCCLLAKLLPCHSTNSARLCCVVLFSYISSKIAEKNAVHCAF